MLLCKLQSKLCGVQAKTSRSLAVSASSVQDAINHIGQVSSQLFVSRLHVTGVHSTRSVLPMSYSNYTCLASLMHGKRRACSIFFDFSALNSITA